MVIKRIAAFIAMMLVAVTSIWGFALPETKTAPSDFLLEVLDCVGETQPEVVETQRTKVLLLYDYALEYLVASNKLPQFDFMSPGEVAKLQKLAISKGENIGITGGRAESLQGMWNRLMVSDGQLPAWRADKRWSGMFDNYLQNGTLKGGDLDLLPGTTKFDELGDIFGVGRKDIEFYPFSDGGAEVIFKSNGDIIRTPAIWEKTVPW